MSGQESTHDEPRAAIRIRGPREFYGGLALIGLALFAFWAARDLAGGESSFGPASIPHAYATLLLVLGTVVSIVGLAVDAPAIERYAFRGPVLVVLSIVCFASLIRPAGLALASFVTFMIGAFASAETRWFEALLAAVALTVFCAVLFVSLLGLPVRIWPDFQ